MKQNINTRFPLLIQQNKLPKELTDILPNLVRPKNDEKFTLHNKRLFLWYPTKINKDDLKSFIQSKRCRTLKDIIISYFDIDSKIYTGVYVDYGSIYRVTNKKNIFYSDKHYEYDPIVYILTSSSINNVLLSFIWFDEAYDEMKFNLCKKSKLRCCKNYINYINRQSDPAPVKPIIKSNIQTKIIQDDTTKSNTTSQNNDIFEVNTISQSKPAQDKLNSDSKIQYNNTVEPNIVSQSKIENLPKPISTSYSSRNNEIISHPINSIQRSNPIRYPNTYQNSDRTVLAYPSGPMYSRESQQILSPVFNQPTPYTNRVYSPRIQYRR